LLIITNLTEAEVKSALIYAMDVWSAYVLINFTETSTAGSPNSIDFEFARGNHGDGYPFDGPGGVLAHAFYPAPPNPEPIAVMSTLMMMSCGRSVMGNP